MSDETLAAELTQRALTAGFSLAGMVSTEPTAHGAFYRRWLAEGRHGEMGYLAREDAVTRREDLSLTMEPVRSVLVVAHEYFGGDAPGVAADTSRAIFARYARGEDYHDVVKRKLLDLLRWLDVRVSGGVRGRAYVDTGPILERDLARRAGLGWFGKNTMLIHPRRGSYFFVGLLLLDIELPPSEPFESDRCGTCRACLDACPTGALLGRDDAGAPVIDARRCISYLTIELRGPIPVELRPAIGNRVFGCDICQEACPWNERFASLAPEEAYMYRPETGGMELVDLAGRLLATDEGGFRALFPRSPVRRARRAGLLRNLCVALGNWGSDEAVPVLVSALDDGEPLVRGHAAWALGRIATPAASRALRSRRSEEDDPFVVSEIEAALAPVRRGG